jgi:hypothetical protein
MLKVVEIAKAWISSENPTPQQKEIAEYRASVCSECPFSKYSPTINLYYCGECNCPLSRKIFSPLPGSEACPKQFWKK